MQLAIRPILMAGIAFAGAGVIATAPFTPSLPDVQIPSITTPTLELAAPPSYFNGFPGRDGRTHLPIADASADHRKRRRRPTSHRRAVPRPSIP